MGYPFAPEYGDTPLVPMHANENPLGPPPLVRKVLKKLSPHLISRYPDPSYPTLRKKIAERQKEYRISLLPESIVLGNGSDDVIEIFIRNLAVESGKRLSVIVPEPNFAFFKHCALYLGLNYVPVHGAKSISEVSDPDFEKILKTVRQNIPCVVCLSNPCNPTGRFVPLSTLADFLSLLPDGAWLLVDEAYFEFAFFIEGGRRYASAISLTSKFPVFVVRTFSKAYGLAGVRLGWGAGPADIIKKLWSMKQPFNVSAVAVALAETALDDTNFLQKTLRTCKIFIERCEKFFLEHGIEFVKSYSNFVVFRKKGQDTVQRYREMGFLVRDLAGYGLPDAIRASFTTNRLTTAFLQATQKIYVEI